MTHPLAASHRTVTLRSASGKPLVTLRALPAAAAAALALALAPRVTAAAAVLALARRLSLTFESPVPADPATLPPE